VDAGGAAGAERRGQEARAAQVRRREGRVGVRVGGQAAAAGALPGI
jgi:hypothetical protein